MTSECWESDDDGNWMTKFNAHSAFTTQCSEDVRKYDCQNHSINNIKGIIWTVKNLNPTIPRISMKKPSLTIS